MLRHTFLDYLAMNRVFPFIISLLLLSACTSAVPEPDQESKQEPSPLPDTVFLQDPVGSYVRGVDCSWLTEQEEDGVLFADSLGTPMECMRLMRLYGINAMRLRVWVNHSTGWCNPDDVLRKARRARDLGYRLMIDFHYSDYFCDPSQQTTPQAWKDYDLNQLCQALTTHTCDVLQSLKQEDITPEWIQVGNETRNGMCWPLGKLWDTNGDIEGGWTRYASLELAGYNAVKSIFPDAKVIVHLNDAYQDNNWFYRRLKQEGGKFDIIGLSHYPMQTEWSGKTWQQMNSEAITHMTALHNEFDCPIMLCEVGTLGDKQQEQTSRRVLEELLPTLHKNDWFAGAFYWEPQVFDNWRPAEYINLGWNAYNMGAFKTLRVQDKIYGTPNEAFIFLAKP